MSATIVVGGQYGSEGKGKIVAYLAKEFDLCVKSAGPNAGHTVIHRNKEYKLRTIPSAFVNKKCTLALCAASIIDVSILRHEINLCTIKQRRLVIDENAVIITNKHIEEEQNIVSSIASTGKGVGAAIIEKIKRSGNITLAKDIKELKPYLGKVANITTAYLKDRKKILVEGTQGFGLSLHHGQYPYVTSRDTTAGTLCGEIGIGIKNVAHIILVIRTFPIRVGGNSGPLQNETSWASITNSSKYPHELAEFTTVTNRLRRVAHFDMDMIAKAAICNSATEIALNFVDYLDYTNKGINQYDRLSKTAKNEIEKIEAKTNIPITLIGTGPGNHEIIDLRKK
ncbi:MAG: adenylosuccinate synthetase [Bacteroidota bacterium]